VNVRLIPLVLGALMLAPTAGCGPQGATELPSVAATNSVELQSSAFTEGGPIPVAYTCDGSNQSPPLAWSGGPPSEEFALILTDLDAPGGGFTHWIVFGIPGSTSSLAQGSVPQGAKEGTNDFGKVGYGGPCPPAGRAHRYRFTLYGLRTARGDQIQTGASLADVIGAIRCCIQSQGTLTGTYAR